MKSRALTLALVAVCAYAVGAGKTIVWPPHLSSSEFIRQWRGPEGLPAEWPLKNQEEQVYAQAYLEAVVDLTQGHSWCSPANMQPEERDDRVVSAVRKMNSQPNAARALLDQYVARFPCQ